MDVRTLLLGDWARFPRDGIDLLRLTLPAGALVLALRGDAGGVVVLGVFGALAMLARLVNLPRVYDLAFTLALVVQGFGEVLGVYDSYKGFDDLTHFTLPMLLAPVLYIGLARLEVVPDPRDDTHVPHYAGVFLVTVALGISTGAIWEIVEWRSDAWLGSDLSLGYTDTVGDLVRDTFGSLVGAALLVVWTRYGWGSVRRIPGVNTREEVDA